MNVVLRSLISEFLPYGIELGHNTAAEETKNICRTKGEGALDHNPVTRQFKKFRSSCKNPNNQARSCWPKSVDYEAMHQADVIDPASSTWRVSGELGIPQPSVVHYFRDLSKSTRSCRIVPHVQPKYCKSFDLP